MEAPVFHLDHVLHSQNEMTDFDGPLDLILYLLSKNKMEIQDIRISTILDQYLAWIDQRRELDLEVAGDFLTMASHLIYIKTRMLLSIQDEEAESEMDALIASLEAHQRHENYDRLKLILPELLKRFQIGRDYITRCPETIPKENSYRYSHHPEDLERAIQGLLLRNTDHSQPALRSFEGIVGHEPYPVYTKVQEVLSRVLCIGEVSLQQLIDESHSRSEIVATFLAVLELCKSHQIALIGSNENCRVSGTEYSADSSEKIDSY